MILKTTVGELLGIVDSVWETTDSKLSSVSSNILIKGIHKANASWLYVYSTDYSSQCLGKMSVELDEDFVYIVDPEALTKGIRTLNHELAVTITIDSKGSNIKAGKMKHKLPVSEETSVHLASMTKIPVLKESNNLLRPINLIAGIKAAQFAVSKNAALYGVTRTMSIKGKEGLVTFSASDGTVAAVTEVKSEDIKGEFSFNLSKDHLVVFNRLLAMNQAGNVELHMESNSSIYFKFHELLFGASKVVGELPDLKKIMASFEIKAVGRVNTKEFKENLRRAALFTTGVNNSHAIQLSCMADKLNISTKDFEETIDTAFSNTGSVSVKKDILIECISSCRGEELELCFPKNGKALIIKDSFEDDDVSLASSYILMGNSNEG